MADAQRQPPPAAVGSRQPQFWTKARLVIRQNTPKPLTLATLERPFARFDKDPRADVHTDDGKLFLIVTDFGARGFDLSQRTDAAPIESPFPGSFLWESYNIQWMVDGDATPAPRLHWPLLEFKYKDRVLSRRKLQQVVTILGRAQPSMLCVSHPEISRTHAALYWDGQILWVIDLFSVNGISTSQGFADCVRLLPSGSVNIGPVVMHYVDPFAKNGQASDDASDDATSIEAPPVPQGIHGPLRFSGPLVPLQSLEDAKQASVEQAPATREPLAQERAALASDPPRQGQEPAPPLAIDPAAATRINQATDEESDRPSSGEHSAWPGNGSSSSAHLSDELLPDELLPDELLPDEPSSGELDFSEAAVSRLADDDWLDQDRRSVAQPPSATSAGDPQVMPHPEATSASEFAPFVAAKNIAVVAAKHPDTHDVVEALAAGQDALRRQLDSLKQDFAQALSAELAQLRREQQDFEQRQAATLQDVFDAMQQKLQAKLDDRAEWALLADVSRRLQQMQEATIQRQQEAHEQIQSLQADWDTRFASWNDQLAQQGPWLERIAALEASLQTSQQEAEERFQAEQQRAEAQRSRVENQVAALKEHVEQAISQARVDSDQAVAAVHTQVNDAVAAATASLGNQVERCANQGQESRDLLELLSSQLDEQAAQAKRQSASWADLQGSQQTAAEQLRQIQEQLEHWRPLVDHAVQPDDLESAATAGLESLSTQLQMLRENLDQQGEALHQVSRQVETWENESQPPAEDVGNCLTRLQALEIRLAEQTKRMEQVVATPKVKEPDAETIQRLERRIAMLESGTEAPRATSDDLAKLFGMTPAGSETGVVAPSEGGVKPPSPDELDGPLAALIQRQSAEDRRQRRWLALAALISLTVISIVAIWSWWGSQS